MQEGRRQAERRAARLGIPFALDPTLGAGNELVDTGLVAAFSAKQQADAIKREESPGVQSGPNAGQAKQRGTTPSLDFLDDFFGPDRRHIVAIKKNKGKKPDIKAYHFDAGDRAGQLKFITDCGAAGFDLYFSPNPIRGTLHKKASKNDVEEARRLWIDLDPRVNEPLEAERAAMLALLTTNLPKGMPRPNRIIDSGRGYWGYWKLNKPAPVDGSTNHVNGPRTEAAECYGRGIEQAFGDRFADGCRNIDRIARLPGTVNTKTGNVARVLHEFSHDTPHQIDSFPRSVEKAKDQAAPKGEKFKPSGEYEPVEPDDPLLARLGDKWRAMLTAADYAAAHGGDRSRAEFALVCEAIRVNIDDATVARVLMDERRKFGSHTRERADYRLPRIISRGHEFAIDPDLARMNAEHAVVCIGGKFGVASWQPSKVHPGRLEMVLSSPDNFTFGFSNEKKAWETTDKEGNPKPTKIALGAWWLRQERRRQYNGGVALMPWTDAESENGILNLWTGFGFKPAAGNWSLFKRHIFANLCGRNEEYFVYLIRWMAWIVQKRKQSGVAVLLRGDEEGTGKGFFARHYGMLFAEHFMQLNNPEHVIGKFNPHLQNLLLLNADEALFVGDPRHRNALWGLTTEPTITIEPKQFPAYKAQNFLNHIITTNAKHAVEVTRTARRIFALDVAPNQVGHPEYFDAIEDQLKAGGYAAMLHDLQAMDLSGFDVRQCPKTDALENQKRLSRKGVDALVESVCNDARVPCEIGGAPGCSRTGDASELGTLDHFLATSKDRELQKPLTVKRRLCSEWGCKSGNAARIWNGTRHVACLQWPALADLRVQFIKKYGPQTWDSAGVTEWLKGDA